MNKKTSLALAVLTVLTGNSIAVENYDLLSAQAELNSKRSMPSPFQQQANKRAKQLQDSPLVDGSQLTSVHPVLGTPQFFWASDQIRPFTSQRKLSQEQQNQAASRYYLNAYKKLLSSGGGKHYLSLASVSQQSADQPIFARYIQKINGKKVLGSGVTLLMDSRHKLISVSATLAPIGSTQFNRNTLAKPEFTLSKQDAINLALQQLIQTKAKLWQIEQGTEKKFTITGDIDGWHSTRPIQVEALYYPQQTKLIPAYRVSVRLTKSGQAVRHYGVIVAANDGTLLQRKNYTRQLQHQHLERKQQAFQYRVFADQNTGQPQDGPNGNNGTPHPTGKPDGFQAEVVAANLLSLSNAVGSKVKDPWLAPNATVTTGNNVDAYLDLVAPDGYSDGDFRAQVKAGHSLDYPFDGNKDANLDSAQKSAAVTNLFYTINYLHDVFYDAGFDEQAGNAQKDNYGRGGEQNDPILAEGQDYSGINNANMGTPPDGESPVMQQYLFISEPELSAQIQGIEQQQLPLKGSLLGQKNYSLTSTAMVVAETADGKNNLCQPFTNTSALKDKVVLASFNGCDSATLNQQLEKLDVKALVIITNSTNAADFEHELPSLLPRPVSFPVVLSEAEQDSISAIKQANVTVSLSQKADFVRDSTVSNMVVMHEWGHYLHERLAGNGQGLGFSAFGGALGEGYGDFVALLHQVREEDLNKPAGADYKGAYPQGGWVDGSSVKQDNQAYYFGIRRVPYSIDPDKNALSYRHLQPGQSLPNHPLNNFGSNQVDGVSPHAGGEIWASALFEAFIALASDTPRLTLEQARSRMRKYLVGGLKLTPSNPTFLMARDGILATALASDKADAKLILQAFAKRGMGTEALSPQANTADFDGIVESTSTQAVASASSMQLDSISKQCDRDSIWDEGETALFNVTIRNNGLEALPAGSLTLSSSSDISSSPINYNAIEPMSSSNSQIAVTLNKLTGTAIPVRLKLGNSEFSFNANYDIGKSNKEDFETQADNLENFEVNSLKTNPGNETWLKQEFAGSNRAMVYPYTGDLDEVLSTKPFTASNSEPVAFSFTHTYSTRADEAGGLLEVKVANGNWQAIPASAITRLDSEGKTIGSGYSSQIRQGAQTDVDGRATFGGTSLAEPFQPPESYNYETVKVALGSTYAGQTMQIRWRFVSAPTAGEANDLWLIDDINFSGTAEPIFSGAQVANSTSCQPSSQNQAPTVTLSAEGGKESEGVLTVTLDAGKRLTLTATGQDPDQDKLTYTWQQTAGTSMALTGNNTANLTFTVPKETKAQELNFKVTVSDGKASVEKAAKVTVLAQQPTPPAPTPAPKPTPAAPKKDSGGSSGVWLSLIGLTTLLMRKRQSSIEIRK